MERIREKNVKVAVIGDLMIDHYLWGRCERISPEAPVPVVEVKKESAVLGGAGNVINNLISLSAEVDVYSVVGDDDNAKELTQMLQSVGARAKLLVRQPGRKTSKKSRVIAAQQQVIRFDEESKVDISKESQQLIVELLQQEIDGYDAVLLSDYGKGVLTVALTKEIIALAGAHGKLSLVDPKGDDYSKYNGATLLTPNKKEASEATKMSLNDQESLETAGFKLKNDHDLTYGVITLSEDGIAIFDEKMRIIPTVAREVFDVTGAGDTVLASLGVALSSGLDIYEACHFANKAAAVVVGKVGSATVTLNEIEEYEHSLHKGSIESKIKDWKNIDRISRRLQSGGKKVVFTNGCFDILHRGHVSYLEKAKALGDFLILGLNTDASVKRLKGESRPINTEVDRAFVLAALEPVDYVVLFDEDTPYELIKVIEPDVLVKGADYEGKEVVGSDIAREVKLINFIEGKSTTGTIQRIQTCMQ
jgi:D-beta-D-heptose 7-phosphate kinase/D-beta-D-heptose 1-phosphate adenosyltransferase